MNGSQIYERIGTSYAEFRQPDPRWSAQIEQAVAGCRNLVNVGAGAGSYEPAGTDVVSVEPSETMIRQRPVGSAPVVQGIAEQLPFNDNSFDVAMAVLTVHHWSDAEAGLAEMRRVSARQLVVTWDSAIFASRFWLVRDYLPEAVQRERHLATLKKVQDYLQPATSHPLLVPFDCTDGFFAAYWRRPSAYLDPYVRKAISGLALLSQRIVEPAMYRLQNDIDSGRWHQRYADLLEKESLDLGYRIVLANQ